MYSQVMANVGVNFRFYRRNRLLMVAGLLILLVTCLSAAPSLFLLTKSQHLSIITTVLSELCGIAGVLVPVLGLLMVSNHIGSRSLKMVFTKPCRPETWLLSSTVSAVMVATVIYTGIFVVCAVMFLVWGIPFQWGLLFVLLNEFAHSLIWLGYLTFLAVVFHPVVAVIFIFIFSEGTFYSLNMLLTSGIKSAGAGTTSFFLKAAKGVAEAIYFVLPATNPFEEKTGDVYKSLRGADAQWLSLIATWGYALGVSLLFFLLAVFFLKKKRLI